MTIRTESDGTYTVFYSKRHTLTRQCMNLRKKGIKTYANARRVEAELIVRVNEKIKGKTVPLWKEVLNEYFIHLRDKGVTLGTFDSYRLCLNAHTLSDWGERFIDDIRSDEIRNQIALKVGKRSESHQKNLLKYIRAVFSFALERRYILYSPVPAMKFRIGDKLKKVLNEKQAGELLDRARNADSEWYPVWATALYTGMRNGELLALKWNNLDLDNRKIFIVGAWEKGKGFKDYTKSGDDRIAEIAPPLHSILSRMKLENTDSPYVLPRIDKWDKGEQARELRMFLEGCGLPKIRFHDLRASWATLMMSKGVEPIKVMSMGGWKDLKTMQIYIRKSGLDVKGITDKLYLHNPDSISENVLSFNSPQR